MDEHPLSSSFVTYKMRIKNGKNMAQWEDNDF